VVAVPLRADILDNDLTLIYIGGRVGLEHGWNHVYSLSLQHDLFTQLRPHADFNDGERFISPLPYAWLILPLGAFGPAVATYAWLAVSVAALAIAWWLAAPGSGPTRALWLLGALAWYPLLYSVSLAQPPLVIVALGAVAWRLAEANRPYAAGVVLGLSVIKPQLLLLLPLVLLFAGRWRIAAAWAATAAVLAAASVVVIGREGWNDYIALLAEAQAVANNRYFTLAFIVGGGPLSYIAQGLVVATAIVAAYANRHATHAHVFALGIVATAAGATYWHVQDFAVLVLAAWLFWRERPPLSRAWLLLAIAVAGEFAWPLTPLPLLVGVAGWFVLLAVPRARRSPITA
jgi:heme/copper-type cytochrome/quinol oxidase subunit 3